MDFIIFMPMIVYIASYVLKYFSIGETIRWQTISSLWMRDTQFSRR